MIITITPAASIRGSASLIQKSCLSSEADAGVLILRTIPQ